MSSQIPSLEARRALVALFPRFLQARYRGWSGGAALAKDAGLAPIEIMLLREIFEETDRGVGMSEDALHANLFNPYSTLKPIFAELPKLVATGYLRLDDKIYSVTPAGRTLIERLLHSVRDYLGAQHPISDDDLPRLTSWLTRLADAEWRATEPSVKAHQARAQRRRSMSGEPPLIALDDAIYALWTARDDAHMAAWRAQGFDGPTFDVLTQIWQGNVETAADLVALLAQSQSEADVLRGLAGLQQQGYIARVGDAIRLTDQGRTIRDGIEQETDRVYFAPWAMLSNDDVAVIHQLLLTTIDYLASR